MEILEAHELTRSVRQAAQLCGIVHQTVRRHVAAGSAKLDAASLSRVKVTDPFADKIAEWVKPSRGHVRADEQPTGAVEQGDPPAHRRRWHLPKRAAVICLVGAVLAEQHDE